MLGHGRFTKDGGTASFPCCRQAKVLCIPISRSCSRNRSRFCFALEQGDLPINTTNLRRFPTTPVPLAISPYCSSSPSLTFASYISPPLSPSLPPSLPLHASLPPSLDPSLPVSGRCPCLCFNLCLALPSLRRVATTGQQIPREDEIHRGRRRYRTDPRFSPRPPRGSSQAGGARARQKLRSASPNRQPRLALECRSQRPQGTQTHTDGPAPRCRSERRAQGAAGLEGLPRTW